MLHVTEAKYISGYRIWLGFDNGRSGEVDLAQHLQGSMFEPLRDIKQFSKVTFDHELGTVVWPNGADLAPEFLEEQLRDD